MAGAEPFSFAAMALSGLKSVVDMSQASAQADAQNAELAQRQATAQREFQNSETDRRNRLERAQAAQRAAFAAAGVSGDGSAGAAMNNLLEESERERSNLAAAFSDQMQGIANAGRVNLLRQRQATLGGLLSLGSTMASGFSKLNSLEKPQIAPPKPVPQPKPFVFGIDNN